MKQCGYFSEWLAKSLREAKPSSNKVDDAPDFNVGKYSLLSPFPFYRKSIIQDRGNLWGDEIIFFILSYLSLCDIYHPIFDK